jgi:hypothetical protein
VAGVRVWACRLGGAVSIAAALLTFLSLNSCDIEGLRARIAAQVVAAKTPGTVETPVFTPAAGTYNTNLNITITCATEGAEIHFTRDGTTPTVSTEKYEGAIPLASDGATLALSAIAVMSGWDTSAMAQASYTIDYSQLSSPQLSVASGTYQTDQSVEITCDVQDATIYYTTDGSDPTTSSTAYTTPVSVAGDGAEMTLKAFAAKDQMKTSGTVSATYRIIHQLAQWARTVTSAASSTTFRSVAVDSSGNIYAVGDIVGTTTFDTGFTVTGGYAGNNAVIVKYSPSGETQWVQTQSNILASNSFFRSVAVGSGNVYAAGYITKAALIYKFGDAPAASVDTTGICTSNNIVLVKYDSTSGDAEWATTTASGTIYSYFNSVAVDSTGNVYAAGGIGQGDINFGGTSTTITGIDSTINIVLVQYNSNGAAQWAKTIVAGGSPLSSEFNSVAVGPSATPYVYAAGYAGGTSCNFGGVTISPKGVLLVKYDTNGIAQWAKSTPTVVTSSKFTSVALDNSTPVNVYAAGFISAINHDFGNGATAAGPYSGENAVLVKYESVNGDAQWAKTVTTGPNASHFNSVTVDAPAGMLYAVGYIYKTDQFDFGNGKTVSGVFGNDNALLVKYNAGGTTIWAQSAYSGSAMSEFKSAAAFSGVAYGAGIVGMGTFDFGIGKTVTGAAGDNVVLVKY